MKCLNLFAYFLFVLAATFIGPICLYLVLPTRVGDIAYWIALNYTALALGYVLIDSIITVTRSLGRYCHKKKKVVWNYQQKKYQSMTQRDIDNISQESHDLGLQNNLSQPFGEFQFVMNRPTPTCMIIINMMKRDNYKLDLLINSLYGLHCVDNHLQIVFVCESNKTVSLLAGVKERFQQVKKQVHILFVGDVVCVNADHVKNGSVTDPAFDAGIKSDNELKSVAPHMPGVADFKDMIHESPTEAVNSVLEMIAPETIAEMVNRDVLGTNPIQAKVGVGILNANQYIERYSLSRALAILQKSTSDVIQGRCVICNNSGFLGSMIAIEYNVMYSMYYKGMQVSDDEIVVGSSNCWMTSKVLIDIYKRSVSDNVATHGAVATENVANRTDGQGGGSVQHNNQPKYGGSKEIDFSMHSLLSGYTSEYHSNIVVYESCPQNVSQLWSQRVAWAREWICTSGYALRTVSKSRKQNKLGWGTVYSILMTLFYKEVLFYPSSQSLPTLFISLLRAAYMYNIYVFFTSCSVQFILLIEIIVTGLHLRIDVDRIPPAEFQHISKWKYFIYILFQIFYGYFKFLAVIVAHMQEILE